MYVYTNVYTNICPHTTVYVSSNCYICVLILILLHICPDTVMCPHTVTYVSVHCPGVCHDHTLLDTNISGSIPPQHSEGPILHQDLFVC